jgi:hypothetical protein
MNSATKFPTPINTNIPIKPPSQIGTGGIKKEIINKKDKIIKTIIKNICIKILFSTIMIFQDNVADLTSYIFSNYWAFCHK